MTRECRNALNASIRKYRKTVKVLASCYGEDIRISGNDQYVVLKNGEKYIIPSGISDCPLCRLYRLYIENACLGCCVRADTNKQYCFGTPYFQYERLVSCSECVTKRLIDAANAELIYLEGLR